MLRFDFIRRAAWLAGAMLLGLGAAALLVSAGPAQAAPAAQAPLAPAGCENELVEPNNAYTQATGISLPAILYQRNICDNPVPYDKDWYSMTLTAGQHVAIFAHFTDVTSTQDLDLYLIDTNGTDVLAASTLATNNESIDYTVSGAGIYYVEILGYDGAQNTYDLSVTGGCYARAVSDFTSVDAKAVRDAVAEAAPGGTVKVAGYCPGTAAEGGSVQTVLINKTLTLAGGYTPDDWTTADPAANLTTLDAMRGGRVITASNNVTLTGLIVQHGFEGSEGGGGLFAWANVVMDSMTFFSNTANFAGGGAFLPSGAATVIDSAFTENVAVVAQGGGLSALSAMVSGADFTRNQAGTNGGGLEVSNLLVLGNSAFEDNRANNGGGVQAGESAGNRISNSYFSGNFAQTAGGGVLAAGPLAVSDSTFVENSSLANGGGLSAQGPLTLERVTLNANQAVVGGGVEVYNTMAMTDTRFANNVATSNGGALSQVDPSQAAAGPQAPAMAQAAPGRLVNVTFYSNTAPAGPDLRLEASVSTTLLHGTFRANAPAPAAIAIIAGNLTVRNTLLAGYTTAINRTGGTVSEDYNLYFGGGGTVAAYLAGGASSGGHSLVANPLLADGSNGDLHLTFASPARDRGLAQGVTADFEGDPRPYGFGVDIGSDELTNYPLLFLPAVMR